MTAEAPTSAPRLIDGPDAAPATVLLAHGAGAPMDSPFMAAIASGLAESGWRVVRFEFPYIEVPTNQALPTDRSQSGIGVAMHGG